MDNDTIAQMEKVDNFLLPTIHRVQIKLFNEKQAHQYINAIYDFTCGYEVNLKNIDEFVSAQLFVVFDYIMKNKERYNRKCEANRENGKKGGAPKGNQNARKKTTQTTQTTEVKNENNPNNPNDNDNDNEYEYDNVDVDVNDIQETSTTTDLKKLGKYKNVLIPADKFQDFVDSHSDYDIIMKCLDQLSVKIVEGKEEPYTYKKENLEMHLIRLEKYYKTELKNISHKIPTTENYRPV